MTYTNVQIRKSILSEILGAYEDIDKDMDEYERQRAFGFIDGLVFSYEALFDAHEEIDYKAIEEAEKKCFERLSR